MNSTADLILQSPSVLHLLGTDSLGRDYLLRVLEGTGISICLVVCAQIASLALGVLYGIRAAYAKGFTGQIFLTILDIYAAVPHLLLVLLLAVSFHEIFPNTGFNSALVVIFALSLSGWATIARSVRAEILRLQADTFIEASHALGGSPWHVFRYQMIGYLSNTLVTLTLAQLPVKLMTENLLGIVGLGVANPYPSLGKLLAESWGMLEHYPHLMLGPVLVLLLLAMAIRKLYRTRPRR